jgi:2'-5' RNA ligase
MRLFLALTLPASTRAGLAGATASLQSALPDVRWVRAEALHLTLVFLGERPAGQVEAIAQAAGTACGGRRPFTLTVAGFGCFPSPARARVLWAGLAGEVEALATLQRAILEALIAAKLTEAGAPFSPHLTLGRVRDSASPAARAAIGRRWLESPSPDLPPIPVREAHLIQSVLGPGGPRYTTLRVMAL